MLYAYWEALTLQDFTLKKRVPSQDWDKIRGNALRLMKARKCHGASIKYFQTMDGELWTATSLYSSSGFNILYKKAEVEEYIEFERRLGNVTIWKHLIFPEIAKALETAGHPVRGIVIAPDFSEDVKAVSTPNLKVTSETVEAALTDAETLLSTSGAPNALDRVHTAFHGYLEQVCADALITVTDDAPITTLFKLIREKHPKLQLSDPQAQQMMVQVLRGSAQIVDALNPVRNNKTLAHPNQLLDEPEAMLAINAIRTMFHYLDKRLS